MEREEYAPLTLSKSFKALKVLPQGLPLEKEVLACNQAATGYSMGVVAGYAMDSAMGSAARKEVLAEKGVGVVAIDLLLIVETG
ncbi:hypothetical protein FRX31_027150 [Thalictrum thalictroides]|uniref:Uncharacterized protein n=1 Tax=Thalictrum thalictroides TaxID=46969 RepID=A0A7J6VEE1_THATH|nr:hypothetical protein FRX31_027150 [Thalictrum thalictroides]